MKDAKVIDQKKFVTESSKPNAQHCHSKKNMTNFEEFVAFSLIYLTPMGGRGPRLL